MPATGYTANTFTAGEVPTTAIWNQLWSNDASFNSAAGINDGAITWRHLASDIWPSGSTIPYAGASAPSAAWLICNGSAVSRTTYGTLFTAIGTNYGTGDGSTTFNLPDLRGRIPAGLNGATFVSLGWALGEENHTLTVNEMPSHSHEQNVTANPNSGGTGIRIDYNSDTTGAGSFDQGVTTQPTGGGAAHNNIQPSLVFNYIIKT